VVKYINKGKNSYNIIGSDIMAVSKFQNNILMEICNAIADTGTGLTGTEIEELLRRLNIEDLSPGIKKSKRLFVALENKQISDNCGNKVIEFIQEAMAPVRYIKNSEVFKIRQEHLNTVLMFCSLKIHDDGKVRLTDKVKTLSEAQKRAKNLRAILIDRNVHTDILQFCREELLQDNYFHAVFEATKSIAEKIRYKAKLKSDGSALVDESFGGNNPILAINTLRTETEKSEQKGFAHLLKGIFGTFRNTTAHAPKIKWEISENDAIDLLTFISYVHRRLDAAVPTKIVDLK